MPANSREYQKKYRKEKQSNQSFMTVAMSPEDKKEIQAYAKSQGLSASTLLREASLYQIRGTQLRSAAIEEELRKLRFEVSSIANNMNQIAKYSNRVRHVADEEAVLRLFHDFHILSEKLADTRLKEKI